MKRAEFEEREYETPLYNQLARGNPNVWAPGQVFEGHIGIDYALLVEDPWIFRIHGYRAHLPGVVLNRYRWPVEWFLHRSPRRLPTFRLNLFIQAKRPEWGRRVPSAIRSTGLTPPFWRFSIEPDQQRSLEAVASKLGNRSLVVYAAPVFHEHQTLFLHTRKGTIVSASTFPRVSALNQHETWYYNTPGAKGVANPEVRPIEEPSLEERIRALLQAEATPADDPWRRNLDTAAAAIHDALSDERLPETARRAEYFNLLREVRRETEAFDEAPSLSAFLTIMLFCELFLVQWYVVGEA